MNQRKSDGLLPISIELRAERAILESRRPLPCAGSDGRELEIRSARIIIIKAPPGLVLPPMTSFLILRRKLNAQEIIACNGKCRGSRAHHVFRYVIINLQIPVAS